MVCGGIVAGYVVVSVHGDTSADARGSNCHTAASACPRVCLVNLKRHTQQQDVYAINDGPATTSPSGQLCFPIAPIPASDSDGEATDDDI